MTWFWRQFRAFGLAALLALHVPVSAALAQTTATAPPAAPPAAAAPAPTPVKLSDEQLNQIVRAVTGAVLTDLKAAPAAPAPARAPVTPPSDGDSPTASAESISNYLIQKELEFIEKLGTTVRAYPVLVEQVGSIVERVDGGARGRSTLGFLLYVAGVFALATALAHGAAAAARRLLPGSEVAGGPASVAQTLRRALASLIGLGSVPN